MSGEELAAGRGEERRGRAGRLNWAMRRGLGVCTRAHGVGSGVCAGAKGGFRGTGAWWGRK